MAVPTGANAISSEAEGPIIAQVNCTRVFAIRNIHTVPQTTPLHRSRAIITLVPPARKLTCLELAKERIQACFRRQ